MPDSSCCNRLKTSKKLSIYSLTKAFAAECRRSVTTPFRTHSIKYSYALSLVSIHWYAVHDSSAVIKKNCISSVPAGVIDVSKSVGAVDGVISSNQIVCYSIFFSFSKLAQCCPNSRFRNFNCTQLWLVQLAICSHCRLMLLAFIRDAIGKPTVKFVFSHFVYARISCCCCWARCINVCRWPPFRKCDNIGLSIQSVQT